MAELFEYITEQIAEVGKIIARVVAKSLWGSCLLFMSRLRAKTARIPPPLPNIPEKTPESKNKRERGKAEICFFEWWAVKDFIFISPKILFYQIIKKVCRPIVILIIF